MDRYLVISADCHGGAQLYEYRDYLPGGLHDEFDAWARDYAIPWEDLKGGDSWRNWDSKRRLAELESDGIVAEVIFPNTIPPFYPKPSLVVQPPAPDAGDLDQRWIGLHAHNQWLVDFCADAPGRRAGVAQIMLHDVDRAVEEIRWAKDAGLTGGVLLPGAPPGSNLEPLWSPVYEPIWATCEELGMPLNHHSGSAVPYLGEEDIANVMFLLEVTWWAHRALWHLVFSGVLERHPDLQLVFTEQGTAWIPETLRMLDHFFHRLRGTDGSQEAEWGAPVRALSLTPSEYWARQCHVGCSFLRPSEAPLRGVVGTDRMMWGSDYPHREGSHPYSLEALRATFAGVDPDDVQAIVGTNAGRLYGFDVDALSAVAAEVGPRVDDVAVPLEKVPEDAERCPALAEAAAVLAARAGGTA